MNASVEIIGFAASAVSFVLWWPQAVRVWRCRHRTEQLSGVSLSAQVLLVTNAVLWGAYAILTESLWVGAPGFVNAPLAVITIVILRRARDTATRIALPIEGALAGGESIAR